jgi:zinc protease
VINAGSILEDDDQQGLAHFTEHMAFNGTKNFKKNDLVSYLQTIGVEFGADLNAQTGFDETIYILPIPTEKKENVEKGFQILEDWASTVTFDPTEIDKERGIVLEESRQGKGAEDRIFRKVYPKLFEGSKYANRLPIGQEDILKTFKPDVIKRFYNDWYRPNNMAVIVVGDIEPTEAEAYIKKHFEKLKNAPKSKARTLTELPPRKISEGLVATDKEATNHMVSIYYSSVKTKDETTVGDYRDFMIRRLFSSMMSQRMQELTQKANPPFLYGGNTVGSFVRGYEGYQSFAYLTKEGPEPAINALVQEGLRIKQFGFTAAELDRTKKMVMKGMERAYNERDKTESSNFVDEYVGNFLEKETIPGIENEFNYYKQFLDNITLGEVNGYATKNIPAGTEPKLVLLTGPESSDFIMPSGQQLLELAEKASKSEIKAYEEKSVASKLMETTPVAGTIKGEKENKELGYTEVSFSNGIKVLLKSTDFKNDQVLMAGTRSGGQHLYPPAERVNVEFASTLVGQMGVGDFSPTDLRKFLAGKSVGVSTRIGSISESVNGQCSATDVETMLQLTYLYFTKPRPDQELFTSFITKQQALYQNMTADPEYVFQDSMLTVLYKKHPWAPRLPTADMFKQIDLQRAIEIYKERFGNANGFTFVIVGAFDIAKIKPLLATYLGSLPSTQLVSTFKDVGVRPVKGPLKKEVKKGTEPKSLVRLMWNGETKFSGDENLKLQALGEVLTITIIEKLREELGQIYSGGAYGSLNKLPYESFSAGVSFPCGPENVDKLISVTLTEIEKVKKNGPSKENLDKVRETWKQQYQVSTKDNGFWVRGLIQSVEYGTDPSRILTYPQRVDALTPKDLQDASVKYFDMKNYVQFILNPETAQH